MWAKLQTGGRVRIAKTFWFDRADLLAEPPADDDFGGIDGFVDRFHFGSRAGGWRRIDGSRLGLGRSV